MSLFTASLPQQEGCPQNDWPKSSMICTDSALGCDDGECLCAEGWTGKVDFVSSNDCHQNVYFLDAVLVFFMVSGWVCFFVVGLWNYEAIKVGIELYRKGKKILPKTLSYMWFVWEALWSSSGTAIRLITGNRFGYGVVANICIVGDINFFVIALFYFIKSWVSISIAATSKGTKKESKKETERIIRTLQYQLTFCLILVILFFFAMLFITEEVNVYREHFTRGVNLTVGSASFVSALSLYRAGKVLSRAIKIAGVEDAKLQKIGGNMLRTTNALTLIFVTIGVTLFGISIVPFLIHYNAVLILINFGSSFFAPISISLFLGTPPWRKSKTRVGVTSSASGSSNMNTTLNGSKQSSIGAKSSHSSFAGSVAEESEVGGENE